ncbi:ATP-binding protein [Salinarchaeum chitinilyticum]
MTVVIGREAPADAGPTGRVGSYRALDGSSGAPVELDLDGPHAALIVGKRGYGKSYTLGVLAEELARTAGLAPVVIDPMGVFDTLAVEREGAPNAESSVETRVVTSPRVAPSALDPRSWCALLGLSPESGAGGLVWQAARRADSVEAMRAVVEAADAPGSDRRAASNHLALAADWNVFDPGGLDAAALGGGEATVVDVSGLDDAPMNAVVRGIAEGLYRARVDERIPRLPWLAIDEAHTFFDGVAAPALETVLTRGRAPGVSLVMATQRPGVVPDVAISQSDLLLAHRLTDERGIEALEAAQPTYLSGSLVERLPNEPGEVLAIDDATESVHALGIRQRHTVHGGDSPAASEVTVDERSAAGAADPGTD